MREEKIAFSNGKITFQFVKKNSIILHSVCTIECFFLLCKNLMLLIYKLNRPSSGKKKRLKRSVLNCYFNLYENWSGERNQFKRRFSMRNSRKKRFSTRRTKQQKNGCFLKAFHSNWLLPISSGKNWSKSIDRWFFFSFWWLRTKRVTCKYL